MTMTALQQVKQLLPTLSASELQQVAVWVSKHPESVPGIEKTPGICGGSACVVRTRIPVWLLVEAKKAGASEAHLLTSFPALRLEDLQHAWAYYQANQGEIDREIAENENV
ncbi:MAG: DUF433 domain-containing protein [Saprospiraceae bacterium]